MLRGAPGRSRRMIAPPAGRPARKSSRACRLHMYVPEPPRRPTGRSRPSRAAFRTAPVVLKPQYRAASVVVIGASTAQLEPAAADDGAWTAVVVRSPSLTASRIKPRRSTSSVTFKFPAVLLRVIARSARNVASRRAHHGRLGISRPASRRVAGVQPLQIDIGPKTDTGRGGHSSARDFGFRNDQSRPT